MRDKQGRYNDMIDASVNAWKMLTGEQRKERARLIYRRDNHKKLSALLVGAIVGMLAIHTESFLIIVACSIFSVLVVDFLWGLIDKWFYDG